MKNLALEPPNWFGFPNALFPSKKLTLSSRRSRAKKNPKSNLHHKNNRPTTSHIPRKNKPAENEEFPTISYSCKVR